MAFYAVSDLESVYCAYWFTFSLQTAGADLGLSVCLMPKMVMIQCLACAFQKQHLLSLSLSLSTMPRVIVQD